MKIIGLEKCIHKLDEIGKKTAKSLVRKAERQGAKILLNTARQYCPEDTGFLRRQIKIRGGKPKTGAVTLRVGLPGRPYKGDAYYGSFIIEGYHVGPRRLGDARKFIAPNSFIERAYDAQKENAVNTITSTLKDLIEGEANE